ncbi:hypothetical protein RRF57_007320 [Xylaria bambusicola]|uniref:O-methyltransferase n=1 Tax=Xylaria bambusicola TaxID=326684 RepID=A0AAN7URS6_9PEZI
MATTLINPSSALDASEHVKALIHPRRRIISAQGPQRASCSRRRPCTGRLPAAFDDLMRDKMIALEQDKALFVYHICRTISATCVVEAGTSFGLSTIYLALAVGQNAARLDPEQRKAAKVIATEYEPSKITLARQHWQEAGDEIEPWIELREGDLRQTLASDLPAEIDFVLFDIWTPMVLPTLRVLEPNLKKGAVIVADNVTSAADGYKDYHNYH